MQGGIEGLRTFGCLLTLLSGRGLQAASMPGWIVVNDRAWGLENGEAASTPRPGPLAIGGQCQETPRAFSFTLWLPSQTGHNAEPGLEARGGSASSR